MTSDSPYAPILDSDTYRQYCDDARWSAEEAQWKREIQDDEWLAGGDR